MLQCRAGVLELADEADSKSVGSDTVRVRPPPPAPMKRKYDRKVMFPLYFLFIWGRTREGLQFNNSFTLPVHK